MFEYPWSSSSGSPGSPSHGDLLAQLASLQELSLDDFSRLAINGARHALNDLENPLRLNFFSSAMRILFEHLMGTLSPVEAIKQCSWFKSERDDGAPTRSQRIIFAIQGGLSDEFVKDELSVDVHPLRKQLLASVDSLSKHVHGREETIEREVTAQNASAVVAIEATRRFLQVYHECRKAIVEALQEELDEVSVNALISDTILEVDELASHHSLEEVYVDRIHVTDIGANEINFRAEGVVSVILQFGSNSDLRRGDGLEVPQSFPFVCDIAVSVDDPVDLSSAETRYAVDTSEWRDAMQPDDDRD